MEILELYSKWQIGFVSKKEHFMPTRFGASDNPIYPDCRNLMRLTRRMPRPKFGYDFELQTFAWFVSTKLQGTLIAKARCPA